MLRTPRQNSWLGDCGLFPVLVFLGLTLNGSWLVPLRAQENASAAVGMQALAAQLCKDTVWGRFESPTLRLAVSNPEMFPVTIQFDSADFRLLIDDHEFRWRFADTVRETTVPAQAIDHVAFVLRLDNRQWLAVDDDKAPENVNRLSVLDVGHHQIKVYCKATAKNFRQPRKLEAESSLEIVAERLARVPLKGVVKNHLSQPVSGAKLFLMGDGFMQVQGVLKNDISFAELKPMYMVTNESLGGTRGVSVEPNTETDAEGRFEVVPRANTRAVLVLCDQSFPHVFLLDSFRQSAEIRLPETGKLTIEFESSEDAENSRIAIYPVGITEALYPSGYWMDATRQDLVVSWHGYKTQQVTRLEYLKPGKYQISRSVMRPTPDGRSHPKVVDQRTVDICAGKLNTVRFAKRVGQAATFRLSGDMVDDFAYTSVEIYPKLSDFPFDRPAAAYDYRTSDGGRLEMGEFEPGTYRAWVTGYTAKTDSRGRTRNQITHNGIAEFEVDGQGSLPVEVNVEMMTFAELSESSGYRLPLICVDVDGSDIAGCTVYRTTTGFSQQNSRPVSPARTNNDGLTSLNLPHGDYRLFVSTGRIGFHESFNITTPVMGQQELQFDPPPFWFGDSEMADKVKIEIGHHETKSGLFSVKITNQMDKSLPLDQMNLYFDYIRKTQHDSAVRWNVFLEAGHPVFEKRVEAGSTTEFQLDWNKIVETAVWTYPLHTGLTEQHRKSMQNEFAVLHAGPGETFFVPKSPFEIAREATQTQSATQPNQ